MINVVIDDKIPYIKGVLETMGCNVSYISGVEIDRSKLKNTDALIVRTRTKCNAKLLEGTPVKFIATATIGFDHLDAKYLSEKNISWCNAPGCNANSVAQYFVSAVLNYSIAHNISLSGLKLGVVGVGNVGKKIAEVGAALGLEVWLNDPPRQIAEAGTHWRELNEIITCCDIISFHTPLNRSGEFNTFHLLNCENIRLLKQNALIINSSRGEVTSNAALLEALEKKQLNGVILDVWENEPNINQKLIEQVTYGTAHIAGYSADGKLNGSKMSIKALCQYFNIPCDFLSVDGFPEPENGIIDLAEVNSTVDEAILAHAVNKSYNIKNDDSKLRNKIDDFEFIRGNYPIRLEFPHYTLVNGSEKINKILTKLGFRVK